jgi:hypothetical protein
MTEEQEMRAFHKALRAPRLGGPAPGFFQWSWLTGLGLGLGLWGVACFDERLEERLLPWVVAIQLVLMILRRPIRLRSRPLDPPWPLGVWAWSELRRWAAGRRYRRWARTRRA